MASIKSNKGTVLSALLILGIFFAILYTSCTKDAGKSVYCLNGGTFSGGSCQCDTGLGGVNCEIVYRLLYNNTYAGIAIHDTTSVDSNSTLTFTSGADSTYSLMQMVWSNSGVSQLSTPITLTANSSAGSAFTISPATVGSITYTGSGNVSNTVASLTLKAVDNTNGTSRFITFNNFVKQ